VMNPSAKAATLVTSTRQFQIQYTKMLAPHAPTSYVVNPRAGMVTAQIVLAASKECDRSSRAPQAWQAGRRKAPGYRWSQCHTHQRTWPGNQENRCRRHRNACQPHRWTICHGHLRTGRVVAYIGSRAWKV